MIMKHVYFLAKNTGRHLCFIEATIVIMEYFFMIIPNNLWKDQ